MKIVLEELSAEPILVSLRAFYDALGQALQMPLHVDVGAKFLNLMRTVTLLPRHRCVGLGHHDGMGNLLLLSGIDRSGCRPVGTIAAGFDTIATLRTFCLKELRSMLNASGRNRVQIQVIIKITVAKLLIESSNMSVIWRLREA